MNRSKALLALLLPLLAFACSEVTQSPQDCTENEFFDLTIEVCRTCPPLDVPECPEGCGIGIVGDERSCLVAECSCEGCPAGQFFDEDELSCQSCPLRALSCGEGCSVSGVTLDELGCEVAACACEDVCKPSVLADTGVCEACPVPNVPECAPGGFDTATDADGCPTLDCSCPAGSFIDDQGMCQTCPTEGAPEACQR